MILKDVELIKEIFSIIDNGILDDYQELKFEAEVHDNYMERELYIINDNKENYNVATDFNPAILYRLIQELKESFLNRGEVWRSFSISYIKGGEVKTNFNYE